MVATTQQFNRRKSISQFTICKKPHYGHASVVDDPRESKNHLNPENRDLSISP